MKVKYSVFGLLAIWVSSCTTAVIEETNPEELPPITEVVRYNPEIQTIMFNYCTTCHSGPSANAGVELDTYQNVRFYTESGNLINRINNQVNPMPPSGLIPSVDRQRVAKWLEDGFPQN